MGENFQSSPEGINQEERLLAAVGYFPMLFFVPLVVRPRSSFCRFHGVQSLFLFLVFVLCWIAVYILDFLLNRILGNVLLIGFVFKFFGWIIHYIIGTVLSVGYLILIVLGFVQGAAGQYWHIPLLTSYRERIRFVRF